MLVTSSCKQERKFKEKWHHEYIKYNNIRNIIMFFVLVEFKFLVRLILDGLIWIRSEKEVLIFFLILFWPLDYSVAKLNEWASKCMFVKQFYSKLIIVMPHIEPPKPIHSLYLHLLSRFTGSNSKCSSRHWFYHYFFLYC